MLIRNCQRRHSGRGAQVALVPNSVSVLKKAKLEVEVEKGAGSEAGFSDEQYAASGAVIVESREQLFKSADVILQVRALGANPDGWQNDIRLSHADQVHIAVMDALSVPGPVAEAAKCGVTAFALDMVPRITRAQAMDVLSSQANLAGYKSVLIAADTLAKIFPMLMTAAWAIARCCPRVFIIGPGVAGLRAIATARRLGAVVSAYDVRPVAKEQVESLGARFVQLAVDSDTAQDAGGYAKALGPEFYAKQAELMLHVVSESDVVITTAAVPGQKAPILITAAMVDKMQPGSVVVDLAAERGGNCEVTQPGKTIVVGGVTVLGPLNIPSSLANHASQLFGKNITTFLLNMVKDSTLNLDTSDEIVAESMLTKSGEVVHPKLKGAAQTGAPSNSAPSS